MYPFRFIRIWSLWLSVVALAGAAASAADRTVVLSALNSIRANELQHHVDELADDTYEGREAGSAGGRAAAQYLVQHFKAIGLQGAGDDGGYLQPFGRGHRNVLGLLEGSDPLLKQEYIIVGAHYDHVGYGNRRNSLGPIGYIHNGADDNASGVSGVLETIDAFMSLPEAPRRSVLFVLWDGEEKGLLGSRHFLNYPTVPHDQITFALNVDMIGRMKDRRLFVFGTRSASGLRRLVSECNQLTDLELHFTWEMKANSDHYSFFAQDIPIIMLHTGMHDDCHRPSDDADLVNSSGMQHASRLLFNLAYELADRENTWDFRTIAHRETPAHRKQLEDPLPPRPPRLGVRWSDESLDEGLLLSTVEPGSAAERSGLRAGDRVIEFGGSAIVDMTHFRRRVLAARSPVPVVVARPSIDEPLELEVELDGKPTRLGVSWRTDEAEPGTMILTRVIPGSSAQLGGLQTGDRVYAVGGQPLADSDAFFELVTTLPSPLELTIERKGRLQTVTLEMLPAEVPRRL